MREYYRREPEYRVIKAVPVIYSADEYNRANDGARVLRLRVIFQPIFGIPSNYDVIYRPHRGGPCGMLSESRHQTSRWQFSILGNAPDARLSAFKGISFRRGRIIMPGDYRYFTCLGFSRDVLPRVSPVTRDEMR